MVFESFPELRPLPMVTAAAPPPQQAQSLGYQDPLRSDRLPQTNPPYQPPHGVGRGDLDPNFNPPGRGGEGSLVGISYLQYNLKHIRTRSSHVSRWRRILFP